MGKVPSNHDFNAVDGGNRDVQCVFWILIRNAPPCNEFLGKHSCAIVNIQHTKRLDCGQPSCGLLGIASCRFFIDQRRYVRVVGGSQTRPQFTSHFLVASYQQVPARPCREVTHDRCFDVDLAFQCPNVSIVSGLLKRDSLPWYLTFSRLSPQPPLVKSSLCDKWGAFFATFATLVFKLCEATRRPPAALRAAMWAGRPVSAWVSGRKALLSHSAGSSPEHSGRPARSATRQPTGCRRGVRYLSHTASSAKATATKEPEGGGPSGNSSARIRIPPVGPIGDLEENPPSYCGARWLDHD